MSAASSELYRARFVKVLEHIEAHLDQDLCVERLGAVAAFSRCHFHRQFAALFGVNVSRYVQLRRLRRASYRLAFRCDSILDIALGSGYDAPEAFARAFRKAFEQSPSAFRKRPDWTTWSSAYSDSDKLRSRHMKRVHRAGQVEIREFKEKKVGLLVHRGDPRRLGDSIRDFIAWRKENGLTPGSSETFNILYDDSEEVAPEDFRFGLCATTDRDVDENPYGVVMSALPGGPCAVLRHFGSDDLLETTIRYLYFEWLPQSGEEPRDFPLFLQRLKFFPDVSENESITDVFLPLERRLGE